MKKNIFAKRFLCVWLVCVCAYYDRRVGKVPADRPKYRVGENSNRAAQHMNPSRLILERYVIYMRVGEK